MIPLVVALVVYLTLVDLFNLMYRLWSSSIAKSSSNYWDFDNLVETMKTYGRERKLEDYEVFLLIDNSMRFLQRFFV